MTHAIFGRGVPWVGGEMQGEPVDRCARISLPEMTDRGRRPDRVEPLPSIHHVISSSLFFVPITPHQPTPFPAPTSAFFPLPFSISTEKICPGPLASPCVA